MIDLPKIFSWKMAFWILKLKGTETHKIIPDRKMDWIDFCLDYNELF